MEGEKKQVSLVSAILIAVLAAIVVGILGFWLGSVFSTSQDKPQPTSNNQVNVSTNVTTNTTTTNSSTSNSTGSIAQASVKVTSEGVTYTDAQGKVTTLKNVPADRGVVNTVNYTKAEISPNGKYIALFAQLYEGTKVQVYDIAVGTTYDLRLASDSTHTLHGADYQWQSDNKLKVLGVCGIIEECSMFESAKATTPWEMNITATIDENTKL